MNTPVRITVSKSQAGPYNLMYIEILSPRYGGKDYLEPIGAITFQQNVGEDYWYGMSYKIDTDSIKKLKKFSKIAELVAKNTNWDSQPEDVKKIIGADEHIVFNGDFVSLGKNGQNIYKVITNGGHYKNIIAPDEKKAKRILDKLNIANSTLEFAQKIVL